MSKERKAKHFLKKPQYKGGTAAIKQFIADNIKYPKSALSAKLEGNVQLRYDINHKGIVTGAKVISGIGHGCDEEAIRLVKLLKFEIGKNRGVRAVFHKTIRIHFRLPKEKKKQVPENSNSFQYNYTSSSSSSENKGQPNSKSKNYSYTVSINSKES
ncbi:MAG: energy transducer TonB [Saprospiraceae bacterium]